MKQYINNLIFIKSKNIILGTLFYSTKEIQISKPAIKERETEKDRELKMLEHIYHVTSIYNINTIIEKTK